MGALPGEIRHGPGQNLARAERETDMALNKEYFDSIHIDTVKKKYYNANKVEAILADIRSQAEALVKENEQLREKVELFSGQKEEIGDAILSAKTIAQHMIQQAKQQADEIVSQAHKKSGDILSKAIDRQEYAAKQMADSFERVRKLQQDSIEALNAEWQNFLCGLYPEDEQTDAEAESCVPKDIGDKLDAIARDIKDLEEE